jgi:hypothetical protein
MQRATARISLLSTFGAAAVVALLVVRGASKPPVELKVSGFETNFLHHGSGFIECVDVIIRMSNRGIRSIKFESFASQPGYTILRQTSNGWSESPYGFECGYSVKENLLAPGKSLTFRAPLNRTAPQRIGVPYETDFKTQLDRFLPARLMRPVHWSKSMVTTEVIRMD